MMAVGNVRVLAPDHPMRPEMIRDGDPLNRECAGDIAMSEAPDLLRPLGGPYTGGFWCTRTYHPEGTPHACLAGPPEPGVGSYALIVWGGE